MVFGWLPSHVRGIVYIVFRLWQMANGMVSTTGLLHHILFTIFLLSFFSPSHLRGHRERSVRRFFGRGFYLFIYFVGWLFACARRDEPWHFLSTFRCWNAEVDRWTTNVIQTLGRCMQVELINYLRSLHQNYFSHNYWYLFPFVSYFWILAFLWNIWKNNPLDLKYQFHFDYNSFNKESKLTRAAIAHTITFSAMYCDDYFPINF